MRALLEQDILGFLRQNEVGRRACVDTPFGRRLLTYADLTASGRYLHFVEAWIRRVRPFYANTHTNVSTTGRIMTGLREDARKVVRRAVNAGDDDVAIFVGAGATAAINKLVGLLGFRISEPLERQYHLSKHIPQDERPVVFVGPYEHHSNELPWLESVAEVVETPLDARGAIDLRALESALKRFENRPIKIGAFSAASNVTGVLSDVHAIARVLHRYGAYATFDYAAAGPYVPINMRPEDPLERLDAVSLSIHKFLGGPQASGVLVANQELFRTQTPERPGGGTVDYVAAFEHHRVDYTHKLDEREEAGTPSILSDLRSGIAFLVKEMVGAEKILRHEIEIARSAIARLSRNPRVKLLGPMDLDRLAILSFNVEGLHHDLVSALLDHLFGIQSRAGCACAGPYGHRLLGIGEETSQRYRTQIQKGVVGVKPGWVRVSLPYYASAEDLEFVLSAIEFVADQGRHFVPAYTLGWNDGVWRFAGAPFTDTTPLELTVDALVESALTFAAGDHEAPLSEAQLAKTRAGYFDEARRLARTFAAQWEREPPTFNPGTGDREIDALVWFRYVHAEAMPEAVTRGHSA
ncbi:MAG: aminotransferase class V-fold PLP-dependent enzyme [Polyangiales bacterium]